MFNYLQQSNFISFSKYLLFLNQIKFLLHYIFIQNKIMRICQIPRSQQYTYFQNKALHYDKIKNIKPYVDDQRGPKTYRYTIDQDGFSRNLKLRHTIQKNTIRQNEHLRERLIKIMNSSQGYSKVYDINRSFTKNRKDKINRQREMDLDNQGIAQRIINAKAEIGDWKKWSKHYDKFLTHAKHVSKFNQENMMKSKIHIHGDYIPKQFSTILDESDLQKIKSNKKLSIQYQRLMRLPKMKQTERISRLTSNLNQKSQSIDYQGSIQNLTPLNNQ